MLLQEVFEVGIIFLIADELDTIVAVVENFLEICDIGGIEEEMKGCETLSLWVIVILAVLDDAIFAFVLDESEVASAHFPACFAYLWRLR